MIGFAFGIACLFGLRWAIRGGHPGGHLGRGMYRRFRNRGRFGPGQSWRARLWETLDYLDTTPGQEKVIRAEIATLMDLARDTQQVWRRSGDNIAAAIRGDSFDETALAESFSVQESAMSEVRAAVTRALHRIHEVLDPLQRQRLAALLESGAARDLPFAGPYRG